MEKKFTKKSLNTAIYLLLAGMLACVLFISVYTVASKRQTKTPDDTKVQTPDSSADTSGSSTEMSTVDTDAPIDPATDKRTPDSKPGDKSDSVKPTGSETDDDTVSVGVLPATETDELPSSTSTRYFVLPVYGKPSKDFDIDVPVWSLTMADYRAHTGVDIEAELGSDVMSVSSGRVCRVWSDPMMGRCLTIDHGDDIYSTYMNLSTDGELAAVGEKVSLGQVIGAVGESALVEIAEEPHLHLEMKVNGKYVDPLEYIAASELVG